MFEYSLGSLNGTGLSFRDLELMRCSQTVGAQATRPYSVADVDDEEDVSPQEDASEDDKSDSEYDPMEVDSQPQTSPVLVTAAATIQCGDDYGDFSELVTIDDSTPKVKHKAKELMLQETTNIS